MQFGHFDDAAREYVITTPRTPYPWINYLGTEEFFGLISHTGGGYCFYRDARMRRLTRYRYNNVPTDVGGRYYYINDGGDVWTPTAGPRSEAGARSLRDATRPLVHPKITGERQRARAETLLLVVPLATNAEVHRVRLTNTSDSVRVDQALLVRRVQCFWNAYDDQHQLPAQLQSHRRGRGRRVRHLPHDRVPRAAQPLRRVRRQRARSPASTPTGRVFSRPVQRLGVMPRGRGARGSQRQLDGISGWAADRVPPARRGPAPGALDEVSSSSSATSRTDQMDKWEAPGVVNKDPALARAPRAFRDQRAGRRRHGRAGGLLGRHALEVTRAAQR